MKIYLNLIKESWVVDRFKSEFILFNKNIITKRIRFSDVVWIIAPWTWKIKDFSKTKNKKIIYSMYHIEQDFLSQKIQKDFKIVDDNVDAYHVISKKVEKELRQFTDKKIYYAPFWINQNIFFNISNKINLKREFNIPDNKFIIGSFQRDSEGHDVKKPKLIKGPDRFVKIIEYYNERKDIHIVLSGKRRNYVINELEIRNIPYTYIEMASFDVLNKLYNILDLYIVASRIEGGPQSILETAITKTPIISTNVGIASEILSPDSIFEMSSFSEAVPNIDYAFEKVVDYKIPAGFEPFLKMFRSIS